MQDRYNLIVIGGGPGGYVAAIKGAHLGLSVALIERQDLGGTCLNRGCIPTKTVLHTAELAAELAHVEQLGLRIEGVSLDYDALRTHTADVIAQLKEGVEDLLAANNVEVIRGSGLLARPAEVEVGGRTLHADNIIVATGSSPAVPPIEGVDTPGVHTSDTLLETIPHVERLAIIGGGVIGMEFAGIYAALGAHVTVLEAAPRILPTMDREFAQSLSMTMKKRECSIATGAFVQAIEHNDGGLSVRYTLKDQPQSVEADAVLVSTGRIPNTRNLFAEGFSIDLDRGRIVVDKDMRTSVPHLFAIGDAAGTNLQLAHVASAQGIIAACAAADVPCDIDAHVVPSCVYTSPEIASVGLTEAQAKEADIAVRVGKFVLSGNGKTIITQQDRSFAKIIVEASTDHVIGAQIMCGRATDIIGEVALAITAGLTIEQFANVVRAHPTFEESLGEAAESLLGGAIHARPLRK